jgi:hypothetical protein
LYCTLGAVVIRLRSNSRSSRSWMISMCRRPEEAAAEAEAERRRRLRLVGHRGVVEHQLAQRVLEVLVVGGVDREHAGEHHRLDRLEAGQRRRARAIGVGHRVADPGVRDVLDRGGDDADLAGGQLVDLEQVRRAHRDQRALVGLLGVPEPELLVPFLTTPLNTRTSTTTPRNESYQLSKISASSGASAFAGRRRDPLHQRLDHVGDAEAGLGADQAGVRPAARWCPRSAA